MKIGIGKNLIDHYSGEVTIPESPVLVSAIIENAAPTNLVLTFDRNLDDTYDECIDAFEITGKTVTDISISGSVATLTVTAFVYGETLNVEYTKIIATGLRSTSGSFVESVTQSITNNVEEIVPSISMPTGLGVVWGAEDYAVATWTDTNSGTAQYEFWESRNGGAYILVATTAAGAITCNDTTWQNESMAFKIRAKIDAEYSDFTAPITLTTPMVWKVVLTTDTAAGRTLTIAALTITAGKTVNFAWGDTNNNDYTSSGARSHIYAATGTYYCLITKDINFITLLRNNSMGTKLRHSLSKLNWPATLVSSRMYGNSITGTIDASINALTITEAEMNYCLLNGDWTLVTSMPMNKIEFNDMTNLPRYALIHTATLVNASTNNVVTADLNIWLAWLSGHIATNAPTQSCTYTLNGTGMGTPTGGASNTAIVAVKAAYVVAGKVATFVINT